MPQYDFSFSVKALTLPLSLFLLATAPQAQQAGAGGRFELGALSSVTPVLMDGTDPEWFVKFHIDDIRAYPDFSVRNDFVFYSPSSRKFTAVVWNFVDQSFANYFRIDEFYTVFANATPYERRVLAPLLWKSRAEQIDYQKTLEAKFQAHGDINLLNNAFNSENDYLKFLLEYHTVDLLAERIPAFVYQAATDSYQLRRFSYTYNIIQKRIGRLTVK